MPKFVHLHVHSSYSLLVSTLQPEGLIERARQASMPAVGLTDHGNLFAAITFYTRCLKAGIKPILGAQVWVVEDCRSVAAHPDKEVRDQLILLCRDLTGWKNLLQLVSVGYLEGFHGKPRIDWSLLSQHHQGLIALSAGPKGGVARLLSGGQPAEAHRLASRLRDLFQDGSPTPNFYLEVQRHGLQDEELLIRRTVELAMALNLPLVATNDVHFGDPEQLMACDTLRCIGEGRTLRQEDRPRLNERYHFASGEEMAALFADLPEAVANTVQIATRCNLQLQLGKPILPEFAPPEGASLESWLRREAEAGLAGRLTHYVLPTVDPATHPVVAKRYRDRLAYELDVIVQMGFASYFLIVADFIRWAKAEGIPVGPGRGSGAGSLVAWSLQITDLDPIRYQLLFERFLNPERVSMPDFDVDFCQDRREEVIQYVQERYGRDRVAQIITFGTLLAKGVIRDVGRVLEMPYGRVDRIAKLIPMTLNITLEQAIREEPRLAAMMDEEPEVKELIQLALALEGLPRSAGTHAAGVVIANGPLTATVPLYLDPRSSMPVTQFNMGDVEKAGMVKFDFLGLKTLTVIQQALVMINATRQEQGTPPVDILAIDLNDPLTYRLLREGRTRGIFQLESSGMREILRKLAPDTFEEIIALVALYRPGPLGSGMVDDFINRKHGRAVADYVVPQLEPILRETHGVILYQEQVMKVAQVLAGYSLGGADLLRRAMGKKKKEEMAAQRAIFVNGAVERQVAAEQATHLFDLMEKFAEYGFNKSHSAAYALISCQTAWIKAHYPLAFMAATMTCDLQNTDKLLRFIRECREMRIPVLSPDLNRSHPGFTVEGNGIRYGLAAIKNVGEGAVASLVRERERRGAFRNLGDLCRRMESGAINRRVLESLIKSGACDGFHPDRGALLAQLPEAMSAGSRRQQERSRGIRALFEEEEEEETTAAGPDPVAPGERAALHLGFERESLGFFLTDHPLRRYEEELAGYGLETTLAIRQRLGPGGRDAHLTPPSRTPKEEGGYRGKSRGRPSEVRVVVAGMASEVKVLRTRKGDRMAFFTLEDAHGRMEATLFPEGFALYQAMLAGDDPVVVVTATVVEEEEELKLQVDEVTDLDGLRGQKCRAVRIAAEEAAFTEAMLDRLTLMLRDHAGGVAQVELVVDYPEAKATFLLGDPCRVQMREGLLNDLMEVFGSSGVRLIRHDEG